MLRRVPSCALAVVFVSLVVGASGSSGQTSGVQRGGVLPGPEQWPRLSTVVPGGTYAAFGVDGHVHSSISRDARHPPALVGELAAMVDLDVLVLTDHGGSHGAERAERPGLLVLPGVEVGGEFGHAVVWGTQVHAREYRKASSVDLAATAALAHADGGIVALAHPGWWISRHPHDPRMWMDRHALQRGGLAEGLDALELWNGVYPRYTEALLRDWVDLWEAGTEIPIVGNSDFHTRARHHLGTPRTFVLCPVPLEGTATVDRQCVIDAARRGRSYLSQGPAIAWSADGRVAGERVVREPGSDVELTVEVQLRDLVGQPVLEVLTGNDVVEARPLSTLHSEHRVRVTMPAHDTPLWLRVAYGSGGTNVPPFALVTNPITLDVPPARTDTREAAGGRLVRLRYALPVESRDHWAADRWVRERLQALVLQDRSSRIQSRGLLRRR